MVQGSHLENTHSCTCAHSCELVIETLDERGGKFGNENTAEDWQEQLLADQDGKDPDYSTKSKAARITHEDLRRIRVIPEETNCCTDKCRGKDYQFFCSRDKHRIEIACHIVVRGDVG